MLLLLSLQTVLIRWLSESTHTRYWTQILNIKLDQLLLCRDAVVLQHTYEIFSTSVELSVHDNVLLVHHLDSSTVLLLDVRARSNGPIAGPLPLAIALEDQVGYFSLLPLQPVLQES